MSNFCNNPRFNNKFVELFLENYTSKSSCDDCDARKSDSVLEQGAPRTGSVKSEDSCQRSQEQLRGTRSSFRGLEFSDVAFSSSDQL